MSGASPLLADDHASLDKLLNELQVALDTADVEAVDAKLDLFWARLAVHIRAEHLHLFPVVLQALKGESNRRNAESVVKALRVDHEFFMYELARAVALMRDRVTGKSRVEHCLKGVRSLISKVKERLVTHNDIEENKVYRWATNALSESKQSHLAADIKRELDNRPNRFSRNTWLND